MYLIGYICGMEGGKAYIRKIFWTAEFMKFYNELPDKVQAKFDYVLGIIRMERIISTKFVKHLENTDLYEMRVSVGTNEYRTIMFTMDNANVMLATQITLLNAFIKKSTKDYQKQIKIAENILIGLVMKKIDTDQLMDAETVLTQKYGAPGTESRKKFEEKAKAYYYGVILRDRRKELKMTQAELAEKTGTARSYIARVERGETDMQLSNFLRIASALRISFMPVFS